MIKACSNNQLNMQVGESTRILDIRKKDQMAKIKKNEAKSSAESGSIYDDLEIVLSKTFDEDDKKILSQ